MAVTAVRVRRGHQLRLVIPAEDGRIRKPRRDGKLVALIGATLTARKLIEDNPDRSLASIAADQGRCRTRLGNLVRLSCLAPDVVTSIVEGRQPDTLTTKSLTTLVLPLEWTEQRKALGFV